MEDQQPKENQKPNIPKLRRMIGVNELLNKKRTTYPFEGEWLRVMGQPQTNAVIMIWGQSGNGKTRFSLQLCKYLCQFNKVLVNSLEEGDGESIAKAYRETDMHEVDGKIFILPAEPIEELKQRLRRKKQPRIVIIDSVQYTGMNYKDYIMLKEEFKKTMFILISHAKGNDPNGAAAVSIRYDAMVKIQVIGYVAHVTSRFGGNQNFVIWEEGAKQYWGKKYKSVIDRKYWPGQKK